MKLVISILGVVGLIGVRQPTEMVRAVQPASTHTATIRQRIAAHIPKVMGAF